MTKTFLGHRNLKNFLFCVCVWYQGLNPGAFYIQTTPPTLFFILYFETGSHEVAEGLTKEREKETGREREKERERERAEAGREPEFSGLNVPSTGITSVCHHARLYYYYFETGLTKLWKASLNC